MTPRLKYVLPCLTFVEPELNEKQKFCRRCGRTIHAHADKKTRIRVIQGGKDVR